MAAELGWVGDRRFGLPRVVSLQKLYEFDFRGRVSFSAGMDVINVMQRCYDEEFKYQLRRKAPFALVDDAKDDDAFFDAFLGRYPDDPALKYIADAFKEVFEPELLPGNVETSLRIVKEHFAGPLFVTRYTLEEDPGRGARDETFFVFDPSDAGDVIDYWNYRLVERRVRPINFKWLPEHADLIRERILQVHRPIPGNPSGTMFHTDVHFARSVDGATMLEARGKHLAGLPEHSFFLGRDPTLWDATTSGDRWRETKILIKAESVPFEEEVNPDGHVRVPAPAPAFRNATRAYAASHWMNVVVPNSSCRGEEVAIVYPSSLWNPAYPRLATGDNFAITREGWAIAQQLSIGYSLLSPVGGSRCNCGMAQGKRCRGTPF